MNSQSTPNTAKPTTLSTLTSRHPDPDPFPGYFAVLRLYFFSQTRV
jgi:hypothetical protein